MKIDRIIGIDPGLCGAIAWVSWDGKQARVFDAPRAVQRTTSNRGYDTVSMSQTVAMIVDGHQCRGALEQVHSIPGEGHMGAFTFGFGFALWQGMLASAGVPFETVDSRRWQGELGMEICEDRRVRKNNSRAAAMKFFPHMSAQFARVKDDGRAEALLIAEWLRRKLVMASSMQFDADSMQKQPVFEDASRYNGKGGGILKLMDKIKKEKEAGNW